MVEPKTGWGLQPALHNGDLMGTPMLGTVAGQLPTCRRRRCACGDKTWRA